MSDRIIVIGAGMAGLACARALKSAGREVLVLDKGRGIGGRMATRRIELNAGAMRFDHGAQYFTVRTPEFSKFLATLPQAVSQWQDGGARAHFVGLPGMSGLPRAMAQGLEVRQSFEVTALNPVSGGWQVVSESETLEAARLVLTVPAPQALRLLGDHPLAEALVRIRMAPCLTLMAAFPPDTPCPFVNRRAPDQPLAWIAQDSNKPGRAGPFTTWVAQAGPDWSAKYLELEGEAIATLMLPLICAEIGADPEQAIHSTAHRWRYAQVTDPLGQPFLRSDCGRLHLGGDWCLGARVEAAWLSGQAIAANILA
jgi:renalase